MTVYLAKKEYAYEMATQGTGSFFWYDLMLKIIADCIGCKHHCEPMEDIGHSEDGNLNSNYLTKSANVFFNFDSIYQENKPFQEIEFETLNDTAYQNIKKLNEEEQLYLIKIKRMDLIESIFANPNLEHKNYIFDPERINRIKNNFIYLGKKYFDENINIAIHMRSMSKFDDDFQITREYYEHFPEVFLSRYNYLINCIKNNFPNRKVNIHIYSQSNKKIEKEFNYNDKNIKTYVHLNRYPIEDIYHMSNADILFTGNSTMSFICALLNVNLIFVRDNWNLGNLLKPGVIKIDIAHELLNNIKIELPREKNL